MKAFLNHKHKFLFKVEGRSKPMIGRAKVRPGRVRLPLLLKAEHVRESMVLRGVGNTQTCAMAQCVKDQANIFPHAFAGYIDWSYSRCYVVSKLDRNHMPSECYVYRHGDEIAKLNDTPGGQEKLLEELKKHGSRTIQLLPFNRRSRQSRIGQGTRDGSRSPRIMFHGAKLRYATAKLGGVEL